MLPFDDLAGRVVQLDDAEHRPDLGLDRVALDRGEVRARRIEGAGVRHGRAARRRSPSRRTRTSWCRAGSSRRSTSPCRRRRCTPASSAVPANVVPAGTTSVTSRRERGARVAAPSACRSACRRARPRSCRDRLDDRRLHLELVRDGVADRPASASRSRWRWRCSRSCTASPRSGSVVLVLTVNETVAVVAGRERADVPRHRPGRLRCTTCRPSSSRSSCSPARGR